MSHLRPAQAISSGYDWFHSCWSVVPSNPEDCAISQIHRHRGNCLFVDTRISGCQGHRGENEIIHSEEDGLYVTLYNEGGLRFLSGNQESTMQAGDILLWDTGMAGSFDCRTAASGRTILFPRKMVERRLGNSSQIDGMRSNRNDPRTILLRSYLEKLHDLAEDTREDILAELLEASLELTYLCVIDKGDLPGTTQTRATFQEIRKEIQEHVGSHACSCRKSLGDEPQKPADGAFHPRHDLHRSREWRTHAEGGATSALSRFKTNIDL